MKKQKQQHRDIILVKAYSPFQSLFVLTALYCRYIVYCVYVFIITKILT